MVENEFMWHAEEKREEKRREEKREGHSSD